MCAQGLVSRSRQKTGHQGGAAKPINLRMDDETKELIDRAALVVGQNRTDFMVTSARKRAANVLLDQTLFRIKKEDWDAFSSALDEPASSNADLKKLLARDPPWQK
jgi:uncharacterized protein (DUF1778 family)